MRNYEAKSPLFMIKRAGLNYVPRQSYSKNSHGSYILKWILVIHLFVHSFDLLKKSTEIHHDLNTSHDIRIDILHVRLTIICFEI